MRPRSRRREARNLLQHFYSTSAHRSCWLLFLGCVVLLLGSDPAGAWAQSVGASARLTPLPAVPPAAPSIVLPGRADSLLHMPPALCPPPPWSLDATGKLNASQATYSNWTEGGLNTLALTVALKGEATHKTRRWKQTHAADLAVGFIQQDTLTVRKANDRLHLSSALQYRGDGFFRTFSPTLAASLRTQFLAGYNYDDNPFSDERAFPVKVSDFLAPATFTQSVGLTYTPRPWLDQRLSVGAKEVLVNERHLRTLYALSPGDMVRYEAGLESTTELDRTFFEDVNVQSSLRLFAAFNREDAPDMIWENLVSLEFNTWLSLDFELTALYDSDVTQALQMREVVSLGASVEII